MFKRYGCVCSQSPKGYVRNYLLTTPPPKGVSTLCRAAECNKMRACHAANGEDNKDVNEARLRQGFCMLWYENLIGKMLISSKVCRTAYDE